MDVCLLVISVLIRTMGAAIAEACVHFSLSRASDWSFCNTSPKRNVICSLSMTVKGDFHGQPKDTYLTSQLPLHFFLKKEGSVSRHFTNLCRFVRTTVNSWYSVRMKSKLVSISRVNCTWWKKCYEQSVRYFAFSTTSCFSCHNSIVPATFQSL